VSDGGYGTTSRSSTNAPPRLGGGSAASAFHDEFFSLIVSQLTSHASHPAKAKRLCHALLRVLPSESVKVRERHF
jgi:hypothetical protein